MTPIDTAEDLDKKCGLLLLEICFAAKSKDKNAVDVLKNAIEESQHLSWNSAIERAAEVADKRCQCPHHISIAYDILALKKPEGKG